MTMRTDNSRVRSEAEIADAMRRIERALKKPLSAMVPPEDQTVSEWAEKHRRLSAETSAEPGPWRTSRTPYLREIMDSFSDPKVHEIVVAAASQVGKSEVINNCIGSIIDNDPGSILFIQPVIGEAREYSKLRIAPMIRDCPSLRGKVSEVKSRDSSNTILQKQYPGGILTMTGSTEAHALASKPIRYVFGDEIDRWAVSAGKEGNPWDLAKARQTTFYNAKSIRVSTPTIKGHSEIEKAYSTGTMERWQSRCPHCGEYNEIKWADIRYEYTEAIVGDAKTYNITNCFYICPKCAAISTEFAIKHAPAKWVADNPDAYTQGMRSFWLTAFVSPWASWKSIILKFLQAIGDSKKMQVVHNTAFGELWEDRGDIIDEESLLARREDYGISADGTPVELPDGVLVLTCGVDTQDNRLEYEVVGHGHFGETWGIQRGIIMGRPDSDETWDRLDDVINKTYRYGDGVGIPISVTFVDEGGHFTQDVRQQCQKRVAKHMFCIKGVSGSDIPYTAPPKKMGIVINGRVIGYCWQYQIGVDSGKQIIMDNLRVETPGSKYCHFPRRDDYGAAYFNGLLSEHLVYNEKRKHPWCWEKIAGHERNEPLDMRDYALAAFKTLPVDMDNVARKLAAARNGGLTGAAASKPKQKKPVAKRQGSSVDKYYSEW